MRDTSIPQSVTVLKNLASDLQRLVDDLVRYCSLCDSYCTEQLGITAAQGYTLLAIPETESITMNELSLSMKLANSTMTRMVDQLIQKGMVNRTNDIQDRRVVLIRLTEIGRDKKSKLSTMLDDFFIQVLGEISLEKRAIAIENIQILNRAILKTLKSCCGEGLE